MALPVNLDPRTLPSMVFGETSQNFPVNMTQLPGAFGNFQSYLNGVNASQGLSLGDMITSAESSAKDQMAFQERLFSEANAFNERQAELNRAFQASSAETAMQFSRDEAALNRDWQVTQNQKAMDFSSAEAALNRDWQKMMSDTSYQRAVADLRKAGLNPILAAGGSGASTPAGSLASGFTSSGSVASSAQAAGFGASSAGVPAGSKVDLAGTISGYASLMNTLVSSASSVYKAVIDSNVKKYASDLLLSGTRYSSDKNFNASLIRSLLGLVDVF